VRVFEFRCRRSAHRLQISQGCCQGRESGPFEGFGENPDKESQTGGASLSDPETSRGEGAGRRKAKAET